MGEEWGAQGYSTIIFKMSVEQKGGSGFALVPTSQADADKVVVIVEGTASASDIASASANGEKSASDAPPAKTFWQSLGWGDDDNKKLERKDDWKNIPEMSYFELFKIFLWFGARAFGGPIAQIVLMKDELVLQKKWVSESKFMRAFSMYQVLPGPEAMELACWFGYMAKGRLGAFLGGLGFLLPGVLLMLLCSYIYVTFGLKDGSVQASFHCIQVCVAALIFRGTYKVRGGAGRHLTLATKCYHKHPKVPLFLPHSLYLSISRHTRNHRQLAEGVVKDKVTKAFSFMNFYMILWCFLTSVINLNFFIGIATTGAMNSVLTRNKDSKYKELMAIGCSAFTIGWYILYVQLNGWPTGSMIGDTHVGDNSLSGLFILGLVAGCVTFGGAYTTLPFIFTSTVANNGWLTQQQFLDSIAITNTLPTPLVSFVVLPGFIGRGIGGAVLITLGIFIPAFSFTIIGHEFFEAFIEAPLVEPFLDGVGVGVVGLLLQTCFLFLKAAVVSPIDACIFYLACAASFHFTDKYTQPLILITAAIAGQALYA